MDYRLVGRAAVAAACGVAKETVDRWVREGRFPPPKRITRKKVGWEPAVLDEWFANLPTGGNRQQAKG